MGGQTGGARQLSISYLPKHYSTFILTSKIIYDDFKLCWGGMEWGGWMSGLGIL